MRVVATAALLGVVGSLSLPVAAETNKPVVITTLPFASPEEQTAVFQLLSRKMQEHMNRPVRFQSSGDYAAVIDDLVQAKIDVAFLGAVAYVRARRQARVVPILRTVRRRQGIYRGIIIVPKESTIQSLEDLRGKKLALVDSHSSAGYVYPELLLRKAGLVLGPDIKPVLARSHARVVEMVAAAEVDAGACFEGAEAALADPTRVRPIARTAPIVGDPVVVRANMDAALINRLQATLMALSTDPKAAAFFEFSEIDGFLPASIDDYQSVEALVP